MTLSNALSSALSGLSATARGTAVVATNLANALTPGFARREMQTSPRPPAMGGGVQVDGVVRIVRNGVLAQTRLAAADMARAGVLSDYRATLDTAFGVPGETGALTTRLADFDAALIAATARPDSETALARVLTTAQDLTGKINSLADGIQDARSQADRGIAQDVARMNGALTRVADLNRQIAVQLASGGDASALQDARQSVIGEISAIVPVQEVARETGQVALFTPAGGALLDGTRPAQFDFAPSGPMSAAKKVGAPPVGLLVLDGVELTGPQMRLYAGGRIEAQFRIRDIDAPAAQARLDAFARDLHDRLAGANDGAGPGLLTDGGGLATAASERGLANRLAVNAAADPQAGGALWRLRDGLEAAAPGPAGTAGILDAMRAALGDARLSGSSALDPTPRTAAGLAAELVSATASARLGAEQTLSGAAARSNAFETMMRQDGVDSDREMETLLHLERAYASNAKVLQAVDEMLQTLLRMT